MIGKEIAIYFLIFLLCTVTFQWVVSILARKKRYQRRLKEYAAGMKKEVLEAEQKQEEKHSLIKTLGARLNRFPFISKWESRLLRGKSVLTPGEFFLYRFLLMAALGFITYVYTKDFLFVIVLGTLGCWLPVLFLNRKTRRRMQRGTYQLADALGTMANSMRAGFSFLQAMKMIADEFPDPIGIEFEKTLQDIKYGVSVEEAFSKMLERFPDRELELTVNAMLIQRTSGGNLAALLETIQETINGRILVQDEVRTLTAQGKMSSWIITGLPVLLALYLKAVNPGYFNQLLGSPIGDVLLILSAINITIGWVMIRKIVRIEV